VVAVSGLRLGYSLVFDDRREESAYSSAT